MRVDNPDNISQAPDGRPRSEQPLWRQDYAIDWPADEYRSRRDFTKLLGLTSLAFVVGQAWIVALSVLRRERGKLGEAEIGRVDELPVGGVKLFNYPGRDDACLLVRTTAADFVAFTQKCTHLSCPVLPKPKEGHFYCPCHEGLFDLYSGQPLAGPPRRPLPRVKLEVRGGRIYAVGMEQGVS